MLQGSEVACAVIQRGGGKGNRVHEATVASAFFSHHQKSLVCDAPAAAPPRQWPPVDPDAAPVYASTRVAYGDAHADENGQAADGDAAVADSGSQSAGGEQGTLGVSGLIDMVQAQAPAGQAQQSAHGYRTLVAFVGGLDLTLGALLLPA